MADGPMVYFISPGGQRVEGPAKLFWSGIGPSGDFEYALIFLGSPAYQPWKETIKQVFPTRETAEAFLARG